MLKKVSILNHKNGIIDLDPGGQSINDPPDPDLHQAKK
jgi:hypothetical protein